jgi:L-xylulokinase
LIHPGQLCTIAGTWNIYLALGTQPIIPDRSRQCTIYGDSNVFCYIDSSATSASNLEWFLTQALHGSCSYDKFEQVIAEPGDAQVFFLPFIHSGFRNEHPGAMFYGLKNIHDRNDMLRAIAEGIIFAHTYQLRNLEFDGVGHGDTVVFTGGASRNKAWCQMFADIMQLTVAVPAAEQTGTLGDCIVAGVGAGVFPSIQDAIVQMVSIREVYEPRPEYAEEYRKKYDRFVDLLDRMIG